MAAHIGRILDVPAAARMFLPEFRQPEFRHPASGHLVSDALIPSRMCYLQPATTTSNAHRMAFVMPRA